MAAACIYIDPYAIQSFFNLVNDVREPSNKILNMREGSPIKTESLISHLANDVQYKLAGYQKQLLIKTEYLMSPTLFVSCKWATSWISETHSSCQANVFYVPYYFYLVNDVREPSSEVLTMRDKSFLPKKWIMGVRMSPILFTLSMT